MTWTARATVQDVSDGPAPIDVLATAAADETWTPPGQNPDSEFTYSCVVSNTEGKIRSVEVRLVLDEDATRLKPGDVIQITGHFDGVVPPAAEEQAAG